MLKHQTVVPVAVFGPKSIIAVTMPDGFRFTRDSLIKALVALLFLPFLSACVFSVQGDDDPIITLTAYEPPQPSAASISKQAFEGAIVPTRDLIDLNRRFRKTSIPPRIDSDKPVLNQIGDTSTFWYKNHSTNKNVRVTAKLAYRSDMLNMWIESKISVDDDVLNRTARTIEEQLIPINRSFFGDEWRPGIDGDERINILHILDLGGGTAGYFSQADEYVKEINGYSNEREIIYVSLNYAPLDSDRYYHVISHEMQHMIHWNVDSNEDIWINEGLSELAAYMTGDLTMDYVESFARQPDVQLTAFAYEGDEAEAHYGASFLFFLHFLNRYGREATRKLVAHQENGVVGIEETLAAVGPGTSFDELFAGWTAANYLENRTSDPTGLAYSDLDVPDIRIDQVIDVFPREGESAVHQYGADYLVIRSNSPVRMVITGTRQVPLLDAKAISGRFFYSSYPADNSDVTLSRRFDLTSVSEATLKFWTWYDLEEGWDYAYVALSADDGASWQVLPSTTSTDYDPQGNSFGPAFTGTSGDGETPAWIEETIDLSAFTGRSIWLRFEAITDDATHGQGIALENVEIPEIGFFDDFDSSSSGWEERGFIRHANVLSQSFLIQVIETTGNRTSVERLVMDEDNLLVADFQLDNTHNEVTVVISGVTPFTTFPAGYRYRLTSDLSSR